jgi:hypothetical protein
LEADDGDILGRSQAQTLGDTCGLEQVEVQTSDEHNMTNPPGSSLPQLATADLTAAKEATSTRAPTLEEKNRPRTPDSFLDLLIRAHETLEAERRPKTPDSYLQLLIASHADSPDISGCSRKSIDDSYQFAKGDDKM